MSETAELSAPELHARLTRGFPCHLLDVRMTPEVGAVWPEGRAPVRVQQRGYDEFLEDPEAAVGRLALDPGCELIVICERGGASRHVVGLLQERGHRAINLAGGLEAWGALYVPRDVVAPSAELTLVQFDRPAKASLSYLIASRGEAMVVDANRHLEPYLEEAERRGLTIRHVLDTHVHADFISGGAALAARVGATYHLSGKCGYQGELAIAPAPGDLVLGSLSLEKLATPGHTPGSTSLRVADRFLLTGDTLFVDSVGRPDLGGQARPWARQLYHTLYQVLAPFPDGLAVLPGHYARLQEQDERGIVQGTLGALRRQNEGMQAGSEAEFIAFIERHMRPSPERYARIRAINLATMQVSAAERGMLDQGRNECAASRGAAREA